MTAAVRRLPGPFATRVCAPSGGGYAWREDRSSGLTGLLGTTELATLRGAVPQEPCIAIVPQLADDAVVWATAPTALLAFDVAFGTQDPSNDAIPAFHRLGLYLARLHRTPLPTALADLPSGHGQRVRPADPQLQAARDAARDWLAGEIGAPANRVPAPANTVLTHGRFSLAMIAWGPQPIVLGWREAGPGEATTDVVTLLSELAEAVALAPRRAVWLTNLAIAFAEAYRSDRPVKPVPADDLADRICDQVLDHMALRIAVTGDRKAPLTFLLLVRERLDQFCAPIAARWSTTDGSAV